MNLTRKTRHLVGLAWAFVLLVAVVFVAACSQGSGSSAPPSPPPSPSSTVQTTTTVYEAESSSNSLGGTASVLSCPSCSNGGQVAGIGGSSVNSLTINNIQGFKTGQALVGIYYTENGTATLSVSVNGGASTNYLLSGTSTTTPTYQDILVNLQSGNNAIKLYNNSAAAPNVDRIVVTLGGSTWGLMANGDRDKFSWPFDQANPFNVPIGSEAVYQPAGITYNDGGGYPTFFYEDEDVEIMTPDATSRQIYYSSVGWDGGDRCPATGNLVAAVPIPAFYVLPNSGNNNSAAVLESDSTHLEQNQPLTLCAAGSSGTAEATWDDVDIYGTATSGSHGGSGLSALGGTIRLGEFLSGKIHHPMKISLWAQQYYHCCTYLWPATNVDGDANATTYGGTNPNFGPGALLALSPNFSVNSLSTTPGKILAQGFIDYGAYVVDDVGANGWALNTEQGPNGHVTDEFQTLYGFTMYQPAAGTAFSNDVTAIFQALEIVTNNSSSTVGGGGTPRVALAPNNIGN